jgi:hypothetical protein
MINVWLPSVNRLHAKQARSPHPDGFKPVRTTQSAASLFISFKDWSKGTEEWFARPAMEPGRSR